MSHAESSDQRTVVRRRDREMEDSWIAAFLHASNYGFLATVGEGGQPFLNSNLFVFDEERHCIYLHTHRTGRTRDNVSASSPVAFSVAAMGRMLPASEALEFSIEYAGVVLFGQSRVVADAQEATEALRRLLEKYAPDLEYGVDYRGVTVDELKRTSVLRIDIEAWSGKQKEEAADFPGAFELAEITAPFSMVAGDV